MLVKPMKFNDFHKRTSTRRVQKTVRERIENDMKTEPKSRQNRAENGVENRDRKSTRQNIDFGSQNDLKMEPGSLLGASKNRSWRENGQRSLPRCISEPPGTPFGASRSPFGSPRGAFWSLRGSLLEPPGTRLDLLGAQGIRLQPPWVDHPVIRRPMECQ